MQNNRERIFAFLETQDIDLEGEAWVGKYELTAHSIKSFILNDLRMDLRILQTAETISISRKTAKKLTNHDMDNATYKKLFAHLPKIIENLFFVAEMRPDHDNPNFDLFRYYMLGFVMDGKTHCILATVGERGEKVYYDQTLFEESKEALVQKMGDAGARISKTDDTTHWDENGACKETGVSLHTPKFSRILKIWQGEF
jgi:hypothetical protein